MVKKMLLGLSREATKGIFDALRKWFDLSYYQFLIKTALLNYSGNTLQ